jgi:hypothetical protein
VGRARFTTSKAMNLDTTGSSIILLWVISRINPMRIMQHSPPEFEGKGTRAKAAGKI